MLTVTLRGEYVETSFYLLTAFFMAIETADPITPEGGPENPNPTPDRIVEGQDGRTVVEPGAATEEIIVRGEEGRTVMEAVAGTQGEIIKGLEGKTATESAAKTERGVVRGEEEHASLDTIRRSELPDIHNLIARARAANALEEVETLKPLLEIITAFNASMAQVLQPISLRIAEAEKVQRRSQAEKPALNKKRLLTILKQLDEASRTSPRVFPSLQELYAFVVRWCEENGVQLLAPGIDDAQMAVGKGSFPHSRNFKVAGIKPKFSLGLTASSNDIYAGLRRSDKACLVSYEELYAEKQEK